MVVEIYDPKTLDIKTTGSFTGDYESVKNFFKEITDVFYPGCLVRKIDPEDPQLELI